MKHCSGIVPSCPVGFTLNITMGVCCFKYFCGEYALVCACYCNSIVRFHFCHCDCGSTFKMHSSIGLFPSQCLRMYVFLTTMNIR